MEKTAAERRNITMPPDWWEAFSEAAASQGLTLSGWLASAAKKQLPAEYRKNLSEPQKRGRPKSGAR